MKGIRGVVVALGVVGGLGLPVTAHADDTTEAYVSMLHNEGIVAMHGGDATLYAWGSWVCNQMQQGKTSAQIAETLYALAAPGTIRMSHAGSQFFVSTSVAALCPYNTPPPQSPASPTRLVQVT